MIHQRRRHRPRAIQLLYGRDQRLAPLDHIGRRRVAGVVGLPEYHKRPLESIPGPPIPPAIGPQTISSPQNGDGISL